MSMIASIMLIFYGIITMSMLLDFRLRELPPSRKTAAILFAVFVIAGNGIAMYLLGQELYGQFYIFLVQIPLYIGFFLFSRYKGVKLFFVLLSIIVLAAPPLMCVTALRTFYHINMAVSLVVFFICYVLTALFVYKFLKPDFNYMLENCESHHFWLFCLIPLLHYLYTFMRTKYNFIQSFAQDGFWLKQVPTLIVFVSYILLVRVFRVSRENQLLENDKTMMRMQIDAASLYLHELKSTQEQAVIFRHDIRHHLALIGSFAANNNMQKIKDYLAAAEADINAATPACYCKNETVNLILSAFHTQAENDNITLCTDVRLPEQLFFSDTELCSLLSNALENAVTAVKEVPDEKLRCVYIRALINSNKLIISIENNYTGELKMDGELPETKCKEAGHGIGMKSMVNIIERHSGLYSIETKNGIFALRLVIPLKTPCEMKA